MLPSSNSLQRHSYPAHLLLRTLLHREGEFAVPIDVSSAYFVKTQAFTTLCTGSSSHYICLLSNITTSHLQNGRCSYHPGAALPYERTGYQDHFWNRLHCETQAVIGKAKNSLKTAVRNARVDKRKRVQFRGLNTRPFELVLLTQQII